jgi:hypothetical protein
VWNRKIKIIILPATCVLVGAGMVLAISSPLLIVILLVPAVLGAIEIATEIQAGLVTAASGKRGAALATSYFTLALVSQLSATILIIYRIFRLKLDQTQKYARVIEMLVESAAPNCIILICFLPFFVRSPSVNNYYPQAILVQTAVSWDESLVTTIELIVNAFSLGNGAYVDRSAGYVRHGSP